LSENIILPVDLDGKVVEPDNFNVDIAARVILRKVDAESS
jgi:hypothetical protein